MFASWLLLLSACAPVALTPTQATCAQFDYENPADPVVDWQSDGGGEADVWRSNVLLDESGATFSPTFTNEPGVLSVFESWTDPATTDPFCYQPQVHFAGLHATLEVRWYTDADHDVPFQTVEVQP